MLASKIFSLAENTQCDHEKSMVYAKVKLAYLTNALESLYEEIDSVTEKQVQYYNRQGLSYGESSGLLYLALKEFYQRYEPRVRFVLFVRHPAEFVRSALARGFFDPNHPHAIEHLRPRQDEELGRRWETTTPFERCVWYWKVVNSEVYSFFQTLPPNMWRIARIEDASVETFQSLYDFLGIKPFDPAKVGELLQFRINATPGRGDDRHLNPWSLPSDIGSMSSWPEDFLQTYERWVHPLVDLFYPDGDLSS